MDRLTKKQGDLYNSVCGANWLFYGDGLEEILTKLGKIEDLMEEYNIKNVDELEQTLIEFCKSGEILHKCDCCGCQILRESDRYCPECGERVEE